MASSRSITSSSNSAALVTALQKRLNIQWKGAVRLLEQAKSNCEIVDTGGDDNKVPEHREAEVLEEACEIFGDLTAAEQEALKVKRPAADANDATAVLPDWQAKALRAAQDREAAAQAQAAAEAANEAVRARLRETANANAIDERAVQNTRVIAIRKIAEQQQDDTEQPAGAGNKAKVNKRTITCVCNIL